MSDDLLKTLIIALIGTGGATFIWTAVRSYIAWRDSAEGREDKAVARLEKFEANCRKELAWERAMGAYWHSWVGTLEYTLRHEGIPVPERPPEPVRAEVEAGLQP